MASLNQYFKGLKYYTKAAFIYRSLRSYLRNEFAADLNFPSIIKKDYFYHSPYYNRTKQYMHANHFFGELLCLLRGKVLQPNERMRFTNLSSCAPIFDDFFEKDADLNHILQLLHHPDPNQAKTDEELLAVHFLNNILDSLDQREEFLNAAENLFLAQVKSKTQSNNKLSPDELLEISLSKGGYSGLMYAHLLASEKNGSFIKMAYLLGSYGQLMDDVFDLYDDAKEGIRTFANQSHSVKEIEDIIQNMEDAVYKQIRNLQNDQYQIKDFLAVFQIFSSTVKIAIQQYRKIEQEQRISPISCLELDRSYWIIDMEKPANIWRLFITSIKRL